MLKITIKALKGSIRKWERIVDGTGVDRGPNNCPLCDRFYWENKSTKDNCPCNRILGRCNGCDDTPYEEWSDHQDDEHREKRSPRKAFCPECKRIAQAELDYLRGLLPAEASE